jgi:hypothetical protein
MRLLRGLEIIILRVIWWCRAILFSLLMIIFKREELFWKGRMTATVVVSVQIISNLCRNVKLFGENTVQFLIKIILMRNSYNKYLVIIITRLIIYSIQVGNSDFIIKVYCN